MITRGIILFAVGALLLVYAPAANALTEPCGQPTLTAEGNFFTSYESIEYSPEGNLIYRFKNNNNSLFTNGDIQFRLSWIFYDDTCQSMQGASASSPNLFLPPGVSEWSLRVTSPTELQLWNDHNNTVITSFGMPSLPSYTRIRFDGFSSAAFNRRFTSQTVRLFADTEAPVFENTAEKPEACLAYSTEGSLFDSYERAEYVDGLLRVHMRFRQFTAGPVAFFSRVITPDEDCDFITPTFSGINTSFPSIVRYFSLRMVTPTEWQLWDDDRNEPILCTACSGSIEPETPYVAFYGFIQGGFGPLRIRTTPFPPSLARAPDPVIIIPGILGSEKNSDGEWVIDPILHTYDDLIATLDVNHYTPNVDLFTFPYDWRKSNIETAILLKQKIDEVKTICNCGKVDLVAHSMGGLVARQYIQSDAYEQDVDQLIFLGTPHLGAPKAYLMWEGGETDPRGVENFVLQKMLDQEADENGYSNLFEYIRNEPIRSIQELLPTYDYIFDGSDLRDYPTNYPTNSFLGDLNARTFSLLNSGIDVYNFWGNVSDSKTIVGINAIDMSQLSPMWEHGYPEGFYERASNFGLERGSGDETVPTASASFIQTNSVTVTSSHNALPDQTKASVHKALTGNEVTTLIDNINFINIRLIMIKMFSPADLLIVAPDGNKIGKENGQVVNQIPYAFYTGFNTDTEFITILNPLDGEYKIVTQGTGSGAYTVETNFISNATSTEASFTGATSPGLETELTLFVDNSHPEQLEITPPDEVPPVITIASPQAKDYLRSEALPVNVTAEDESDVSSLETRLGTTTISNVGTVDLFFNKLGVHTIVASSNDVLGNSTTSSRTFRVIANATSTIADFERAYSLGWMTKAVHDALIKKVRAIVIVKKSIITIVEKKTKKNVEKIEQVLDKIAAKAILKELDKYRGKGLTEQAYQLLREDIFWIINN